jgi:hypothetical protein
MPFSTMLTVAFAPGASVAVAEPVSSALFPAEPPVPSYVVTEYASVPGGEAGPLTVHPLAHALPLMFVVTEDGDGRPLELPFTEVSVIVTDFVAVETNLGLRADDVDAPDGGTTITNCGVM